MKKTHQTMLRVDNQWFYTEMPWWGKIFLVYVNGDLFTLLPLLVLIGCISFFSFKWMLIVFGIYITVRQSGELLYWLLQQFGQKKYRPYDFGFKYLDNNAIYILYQTFAIIEIVGGISLLVKLLVL